MEPTPGPAVSVTVGVTSLMVTSWLAVLLSVPSELVTWTVTVVLPASPSAHVKLPAPVPAVKLSLTLVAPAPQSVLAVLR